MRLLRRDEIEDRIATGDLRLWRSSGAEPVYTDDFRVGLHLAELGRLEGPVDIADEAELWNHFVPLELPTSLLGGVFYVGVSDERVGLPANVMATIHTRSVPARRGFDLAGSSDVVVPTFGLPTGVPLALEVRPAIDLNGIGGQVAYGFLLFYEIDAARRQRSTSPYEARFPLR